MKIGMTSVYVDSPEKAFQFYTDVLGFVKQVYMPEAYLAIVRSPEQEAGPGLLLEPNHNPIAQTYQQAVYEAGLPVIVFAVDDVQAEYERLRDRGVVFQSEPEKTEWGIQAVFDDTCGNWIQLHQV